MLPFSDKTILITGAARGIGLAIARRLWRDGAEVFAADIDPVGPQACPEPGDRRWHELRLDITDAESIAATMATINTRCGEMHGLVNNAAMLDATPLDGLSLSRYRTVIETNLDGALMCTLAALPLLRCAGPSAIVNVASTMGLAGLRNAVAYSTAKAGLIGLTRNLAIELAADRIRANAVAPGFIATRMARLADGSSEYDTPEFQDVYLKHGKLPMGHAGTPDDIAGPVTFLLSDDASYITGQTLVVDGGVMATY